MMSIVIDLIQRIPPVLITVGRSAMSAGDLQATPSPGSLSGSIHVGS